MREVVRYILGLSKHLWFKLAVRMWMRWSERNKIREEEQRRPIHLIVKWVECYIGEITQSTAKEPRSIARRIQKWQKLAHGFLKINRDASFRKETGDGGWGYVIRDEEGDLIVEGQRQDRTC